MIDEAEVYDVYLLFVWQFSKVLIKLSKVELIFLYFFQFPLSHFYNYVLTSCFCNFTECLKSVPVHWQDHSAVCNLLPPVGQGRSSSKAFYSEHRVPSKGCSHGCRQLKRRLCERWSEGRWSAFTGQDFPKTWPNSTVRLRTDHNITFLRCTKEPRMRQSANLNCNVVANFSCNLEIQLDLHTLE